MNEMLAIGGILACGDDMNGGNEAKFILIVIDHLRRCISDGVARCMLCPGYQMLICSVLRQVH